MRGASPRVRFMRGPSLRVLAMRGVSERAKQLRGASDKVLTLRGASERVKGLRGVAERVTAQEDSWSFVARSRVGGPEEGERDYLDPTVVSSEPAWPSMRAYLPTRLPNRGLTGCHQSA